MYVTSMAWHGMVRCETNRASVTSVDLPRLFSEKAFFGHFMYAAMPSGCSAVPMWRPSRISGTREQNRRSREHGGPDRSEDSEP